MLDFKKPMKTTFGLPVRILCTNRIHPTYPIVGLVDRGGSEHIGFWSKEGYSSFREGRTDDTSEDLVQIKVKKWRWAYTYSGTSFVTDDYYSDFSEAPFKDNYACLGRILETEIEE